MERTVVFVEIDTNLYWKIFSTIPDMKTLYKCTWDIFADEILNFENDTDFLAEIWQFNIAGSSSIDNETLIEMWDKHDHRIGFIEELESMGFSVELARLESDDFYSNYPTEDDAMMCSKVENIEITNKTAVFVEVDGKLHPNIFTSIPQYREEWVQCALDVPPAELRVSRRFSDFISVGDSVCIEMWKFIIVGNGKISDDELKNLWLKHNHKITFIEELENRGFSVKFIRNEEDDDSGEIMEPTQNDSIIHDEFITN